MVKLLDFFDWSCELAKVVEPGCFDVNLLCRRRGQERVCGSAFSIGLVVG